MTAIRRFSRYLKENNTEVDSCSKLDRKIMEEYLIYMKTEDTGTKRYRAELTRLRALLNMVADVYQYPQVKDLILNRDIPPDIRGEIKIYSDQELKRFNAFLTKVDVQTARLMLIHQIDVYKRQALKSLRHNFDLDSVHNLSGFDRRLVCVPKFCPRECPGKAGCRYQKYLDVSKKEEVFIQICNHNYLCLLYTSSGRSSRKILSTSPCALF